MTDRLHRATQLAAARDEVAALIADQARQSDFENRARFRVPIARVNANIAELEAELARLDAIEHGPARQAERAQGRAAIAAAIDTAADLALWNALARQLADVRATARQLTEQGQRATQHVQAALRAHSAADAIDGTRGGLTLPPAAGSDTLTVQTLAGEIKALIEELPGGHRLTSEYLPINHSMFTRAQPGLKVPTLIEARTRALETVRERLSTLCQEPPPIEVIHQRDEERHAEQRRADARAMREAFV